MKEPIKKLYDYCKSQGYDESIEQFQQDLNNLVIKETKNNERD